MDDHWRGGNSKNKYQWKFLYTMTMAHKRKRQEGKIKFVYRDQRAIHSTTTHPGIKQYRGVNINEARKQKHNFTIHTLYSCGMRPLNPSGHPSFGMYNLIHTKENGANQLHIVACQGLTFPGRHQKEEFCQVLCWLV